MTAVTSSDPTLDLPFAFGGPCVQGLIRQQAEDFQVDEIPGFTPDGQGDHVYLTIQKKQLNTSDVSAILREFCSVPSRDIGYAGMKDKHAVTTQTFSINLAGKPEPDWQQIESEQLQVLQVSRHRRKLKRGVLKGNRFQIVVRNLSGDFDLLEQRLQQVKLHGVPNYFGPQRFGRNGQNVADARALLTGQMPRVSRNLKSILLSAARSLLFNAVLAERVRQGNWNQLLPGEVIALDGTQRHFIQEIDSELQQRCAELDVHGSGPLCGLPSRAVEPQAQAAKVEQAVLASYSDWIDGLQQFGLEWARRPLRLAVREMHWQLQADEQILQLNFNLAAGAFATAVLREFLEVVEND
ncbi:MAG: tRNA pseudouridine(13) synthase TruD [Chromatiales bacterium]|jgi:tRNA pseudouridine13 synthase